MFWFVLKAAWRDAMSTYQVSLGLFLLPRKCVWIWVCSYFAVSARSGNTIESRCTSFAVIYHITMLIHTLYYQKYWVLYVTLDHKTSHKGKFFVIKSWINHISIDVWFGQYLKIWNLRMQKNLHFEKITVKVVQMKFLAMHITNQ